MTLHLKVRYPTHPRRDIQTKAGQDFLLKEYSCRKQEIEKETSCFVFVPTVFSKHLFPEWSPDNYSVPFPSQLTPGSHPWNFWRLYPDSEWHFLAHPVLLITEERFLPARCSGQGRRHSPHRTRTGWYCLPG